MLPPHEDVPFRTVWLLRFNLCLDSGLCLPDEKKCCVCISSPSFAVEGVRGKRHAMLAHVPQNVSEWLNPYSLRTMSAFGYIENLA